MKFIINTVVILYLLIFCTLYAEAQNTKIDSIDNLISQAATDTARIRLKLQKLNLISTINLDSGINFALETLKEAQKIQNVKGAFELRLKLVYNYSYTGKFNAAAEQLNYLEQLIIPSKDSLDYASIFSTKGMFYGIQSKYDSSIYFYKRAIGLYERLNIVNKLGRCYSGIAIGYQQKSNFPMALFYQQKSLKILEEQKNYTSMAYTVLNMANTYNNIGDKDRSESLYLQAIELAKKNQLRNVELYAYTNLSGLYEVHAIWQKSYDFAIKAADLGAVLGDQGMQATSLSRASMALVYLNQPEKALALSQEAITLADSSGQPLNINQAYSGMGRVLRSQGKWNEAIPFYEKGFEPLKDANLYTQNMGDLFKELSDCYEKTGNYSKALELYQQSAAITDSVRSRENIQKATELTMNYEFEKKEQAAKARQEAKDEIADARQMALIIGLILSLILIIGAVYAYYNKQKANIRLQAQKKEIEDTFEKLKNTQAQLIQAEKMASLGELTAGIAHEIQNPLNFVTNFSEVSTDMIDELKEEMDKGDEAEVSAIARDIKQNLQKIHHHGQRAAAIVKGMLDHSRSNSGKKEAVDINFLSEEYLRLAYHGLKAKDSSFNSEIKSELDTTIIKIMAVPQDMGRVLQNLINNALYAVAEKQKMSPENYKPFIKLTTEKVGNFVQIKVRDNGNGIPDAVKDKIFQPFFTTKPTGEGTGLGLSLSYEIITKGHGGELTVETTVGEGTEFIIRLFNNE